MEEELLTAAAIARKFNIKPATLYRMAKDGRIAAHQIGHPLLKRKQWRFKRSEVEAALSRRLPE